MTLSWGKDNIKVTAILPGYVRTDLTDATEDQHQGTNPEKITWTPGRRVGTH
jgi:NAD(P)-dependent dehydrogenase (short-subunit alcohol dehydrogenase family)